MSTYLPLNWEYEDKPTILQGPKPSEIDEKFIFDVRFNSDTVFKIRVTILRDATLLCFGIAHHLCDGTDCFKVVQAFSDLLSNKPIPLFVLPPDAKGIRLSDTMKVKTRCAKEKLDIYYKRHAENYDSGLFRLGRLFWRVLVTKFAEKIGLVEKLVVKFIHVPGAWVDDLRTKLQDQLNKSDPDIRLTRNDVIAAWYLKTIYFPQVTSHDTVDYYGPVNYRSFINPPEVGTFYIHNSVGVLRCKFSVEQLKNEPLASIARNIRLKTLQYTCPASIEQHLRFSEENVSRTLALRTRRGGNLANVLLSQWTTFDYFGLNFSGANLNGQKASVLFVNPAVTIPFNFEIWPTAFIEKNRSGNYWIRASNTLTGWRNFSDHNSTDNLSSA